jgi:hypothetical protein
VDKSGFPYWCIVSQLRRYLGILLLRVLDVSPHRHRQQWSEYLLRGETNAMDHRRTFKRDA